jgi:hypothetical protein
LKKTNSGACARAPSLLLSRRIATKKTMHLFTGLLAKPPSGRASDADAARPKPRKRRRHLAPSHSSRKIASVTTHTPLTHSNHTMSCMLGSTANSARAASGRAATSSSAAAHSPLLLRPSARGALLARARRAADAPAPGSADLLAAGAAYARYWARGRRGSGREFSLTQRRFPPLSLSLSGRRFSSLLSRTRAHR